MHVNERRMSFSSVQFSPGQSFIPYRRTDALTVGKPPVGRPDRTGQADRPGQANGVANFLIFSGQAPRSAGAYGVLLVCSSPALSVRAAPGISGGGGRARAWSSGGIGSYFFCFFEGVPNGKANAGRCGEAVATPRTRGTNWGAMPTVVHQTRP